MYLSTAAGSSRHSLESSSSRAKPVCFDRVSNTSGPRLLKLGRRTRFVRARFDPGLRGRGPLMRDGRDVVAVLAAKFWQSETERMSFVLMKYVDG